MPHSVLALASLVSLALTLAVPASPPPLRLIEVAYADTPAGHTAFGTAIGKAAASEMAFLENAPDPELAQLLALSVSAQGQQILAAFVNASRAAYPSYYREIEGMAAGSGVSLHTLLVNNFREELVQFLPNSSRLDRRPGKCSTAVIATDAVRALGHNDDWTQDWRGAAYLVAANESRADGSVLRHGSWVYPGYLPGMDVAWNSHGLVYTVNSLFPVDFQSGGVGTAFAARDLLGATSLADATRRASPATVASAMSYTLGSTAEAGRLVQLEVGTGGGPANLASMEIGGPNYFHGNEFKLLNVSQYPDKSTAARQARWDQLRGGVRDAQALRGFLGDTAGMWRVYRNHTPPDDCYTEVTGIFDLRARRLALWTSNPKSGAPVREVALF